MRLRGRWSLHFIDVVGGVTVAMCLLGVAWLTVIRNDRTQVQIDELTRRIEEARHDRRTLLNALDRQRTLLETRKGKLAEVDSLPTETPSEAYFQTLSRLASRHRLRVLRHNPLPPRRYPGLREQRFAYEVTGSLSDLLRFLKSIEETGFWADVSYLKVDGGTGPAMAVSGERTAVLTLSLFSAEPSETSSSGEDT